MDILKAIYKGEYNTAHILTEECRTVQQKNAKLVEALLPAASMETIERLNDSYSDLAEVENYEAFLSGLRLGIAVMQAYYQ